MPTLDEAIEVLTAKKRDDVERHAENSADACQLGIEALKRIQENRGTTEFFEWWLLPGETEE